MSPNTRLTTAKVLFKDNIMRDLQRYNFPTCKSEIATVFVSDTPPFEVDLFIYPKDSDRRNEIKNINKLGDRMVYPILFPNGEYGYDTQLLHVDTSSTVTLKQFYAYRIAVREGFSILHNSGKLFQQYLVDAWCRMKANILWYIRQHQHTLRAGQ